MINYTPIDLVEDNYDEDYGASTCVVTFHLCLTCGALVKLVATHDAWHRSIGNDY